MDQNTIEKHIIDMKATLAAQHESLKEHMRRTEISERRLELVEGAMLELGKSIWLARGALALFSFLSILGGIALTISKLL